MPQYSPLVRCWRAACLTALLLACSPWAQAQWQWIDGTGRKVFSDTAPPAGIPDKNILKSPTGARASVPAAPVAAASAPSASASQPGAAPQLPAKDDELEARKKQADDAEQARRKAEEQRVAKSRADSCERARKAKGVMDSGTRLATTNAKGEREILDDKARAAETRRMDDIIRADCGPMPKAPTAQ
jgi:type IV secretory pathway VirB10-like protein